MNFLKRATPWMITLVILLGVYVASFFWYYKPKFGYGRLYGPITPSKGEYLFQFYQPMVKWEQEREKQKTRKELLRQCQGEWEGQVRNRSDGSTNCSQYIQVRAIIDSDQFKIIEAETLPEFVGVTWKIGCLFDCYDHYGISSNNSYPSTSSIFFAYSQSPTGEESLDEGFNLHFNGKRIMAHFVTKQLVRPTATPSTSNSSYELPQTRHALDGHFGDLSWGVRGDVCLVFKAEKAH